MKIYIDLAKQAITNTTDEKVYEGDFYSNVFEVLFYNYEDENWFPTMSQLAPNGRKAGDFTADALGVGESHTYVEDGKSYLRFTFTMGATWVLMKGKSNFYIWINRLNGTVLKKCVGMVNVMIDQSTDNYFIADVTFNPNVKAYIDSCIDEQNEVIAQLGTGAPKYFDTAANIALLEEDKGLAVATDTGHLYYWDVTEEDATKYTDSGLVYNDLSAYYTKTESDALLANKADKSTTYTKTESDNTFAPKSTAITHTGNQLQDYSGNNIYPNLDDGSIDLDKLSENVILSYGYVLQTLNWQVGGINTNTGVISSSNYYFMYTDLITVNSLIYIKQLLEIESTTDIKYSVLKYAKDNSYIGYDSISSMLATKNKTYKYDDINVRICAGFVTSRDLRTQTYFDYIKNRIAIYTNDYYSSIIIDNKINSVINDANNKKIVYETPKFYFKDVNYVPANKYDYNATLNSRIDVNISRNGHTWGTDFNISQHMISNANGVTVYMSTNGLDTNDGLTPDTPKLTLSSCLSVTNVDTIILESGIYYSGIHFVANQTINQSVNIICNEYAYFINGDKITTVTDLGNGYYHIPNGSNGSPRFMIDIETGKDLVLVNSTTNMPYYSIYKGGSACIVRLPYIPNSNKLIRTHNGNPLNFTTKCYIQNITFYGGWQCVNVTLNTENIYFKYCKFEYSRNNGLRVLGGNVYLYRCEASYNFLDGFNYHTNDTNVSCCFEIECSGYYNGYLNTDNTLISNNGSTIHYGGKAIRLNCEYAYCKGGVIADHTASSFNFGCSSHNSICYVSGNETNNASIHCIAQSTMYLFDCILYGSKYEISMVQGNGTINTNIEYNKIYQEDSTEIINIIQ